LQVAPCGRGTSPHPERPGVGAGIKNAGVRRKQKGLAAQGGKKKLAQGNTQPKKKKAWKKKKRSFRVW